MPRGPPLAKTWPNPIGCTVVLPSGGLSHTLERRPFHMPFDHDAAAAATLYWYDESTWWRYDTDGGCWRGWTVSDGADGPSISLATEKQGPVSKWRPWGATLDKSESPYARWFVGGRPFPTAEGSDYGIAGGGHMGLEVFVTPRMSFSVEVGGQGPVHALDHDAGAHVLGGFAFYFGR